MNDNIEELMTKIMNNLPRVMVTAEKVNRDATVMAESLKTIHSKLGVDDDEASASGDVISTLRYVNVNLSPSLSLPLSLSDARQFLVLEAAIAVYTSNLFFLSIFYTFHQTLPPSHVDKRT